MKEEERKGAEEEVGGDAEKVIPSYLNKPFITLKEGIRVAAEYLNENEDVVTNIVINYGNSLITPNNIVNIVEDVRSGKAGPKKTVIKLVQNMSVEEAEKVLRYIQNTSK